MRASCWRRNRNTGKGLNGQQISPGHMLASSAASTSAINDLPQYILSSMLTTFAVRQANFFISFSFSLYHPSIHHLITFPIRVIRGHPILFQQHQFLGFPVSTALPAVKIDPRGKSVPAEGCLVHAGTQFMAGHALSAVTPDADFSGKPFIFHLTQFPPSKILLSQVRKKGGDLFADSSFQRE